MSAVASLYVQDASPPTAVGPVADFGRLWPDPVIPRRRHDKGCRPAGTVAKGRCVGENRLGRCPHRTKAPI